jgi:hypothetical protein
MEGRARHYRKTLDRPFKTECITFVHQAIKKEKWNEN